MKLIISNILIKSYKNENALGETRTPNLWLIRPTL